MAIPSRYELKFARVNATSDGDNTVISAVAEKQIVVIGYSVGTNAAGVITFQSTEASPTIVASFELTDGGGVVFAGSYDCPAFQLPRGTGFEISTAAGVDALGHITYVLT